MQDDFKTKVLKDVLKTKKYRYIDPNTIARIIDDLATKFENKKLEKEVKKKLHQIWGAYFSRPDFVKLEEKITREYQSGKAQKDLLTELLMLQTSTKERLPILEDFYKKIFSEINDAKRVIEYGCGINALTYYWMNNKIKYLGYDVDSELINFINNVFRLFNVDNNASVELGDVFLFENYQQADVCFLLKVLVLFDRQKKNSALGILRKIPVKYLVVSFPTKTLTGIDKGMKLNYQHMFTDLIKNEPWQYKEIEFENELVYVVTKN